MYDPLEHNRSRLSYTRSVHHLAHITQAPHCPQRRRLSTEQRLPAHFVFVKGPIDPQHASMLLCIAVSYIPISSRTVQRQLRCLRSGREVDTLRQRRLIREVHRARAPADVLLPGLATRFTAPGHKMSRHAQILGNANVPSGALVATEGGTNLGTAGTDVDLQESVEQPARRAQPQEDSVR